MLGVIRSIGHQASGFGYVRYAEDRWQSILCDEVQDPRTISIDKGI